MESTSESEIRTEKTLELYIYDYLLKRNLEVTAEMFKGEAGIAERELEFDAPEGFLRQWWSFFWDTFLAPHGQDESQADTSSSQVEAQHLSSIRAMQFLGEQGQIQIINTNDSYDDVMNVEMFSEAPRTGPVECVDRLRFHESTSNGRFPVNGQTALLDFSGYSHLPRPIPRYNPPVQHITSQTHSQTLNLHNNGALQPWPLAYDGDPNQSSYAPPLPSPESFGINQTTLGYGSMINNYPLTNAYDTPQALISSQQGINQPTLGHGTMLNNNPLTASFDYAQALVSSQQEMDHPTLVYGSMINNNPLMLSHDLAQSLMSSQQDFREYAEPDIASELSKSSYVARLLNWMEAADVEEISERRINISDYNDNSQNALPIIRREPSDATWSSYERIDDEEDSPPAREESPEETSNDGFLFHSYGTFTTSQDRIQCCDFSPDGRLLAVGGYDKTVHVLDINSFTCTASLENHDREITDARFSSDSEMLVTSSCDRTVKLWKADDPITSLRTFTEHTSPVSSVDFHPWKTDLFCSADSNEIRLWNASDYTCLRVTKEGTSSPVRFQPGVGRFMAIASSCTISISDVETGQEMTKLEGRGDSVRCLAWDEEGDYVAASCGECVTVWSTKSGTSIGELKPVANRFHSCIFHPTRPKVLVIGGYQTVDIWDITAKNQRTVEIHGNLIAALAATRLQMYQRVEGRVATGGYDHMVHIWQTD